MARRDALVTLLLGAKYQRLWHDHCRANWQRYADRHDLELITIESPLDDSARARARSPAWQRLLILGHPALNGRHRVALVDADVLIRPDAPSVFAGVPEERVGGVREFGHPTPEVHRRALQTWFRILRGRGSRYLHNETAREFYRLRGFDVGFDEVVNGGVLVLSPRHHRRLLESVYERYEEDPRPGALAEMAPLSWELMRADLVHWLDPRFNVLWPFYKAARFPFLFAAPEHPALARCAQQAFSESFFLHFAAFHEELPALDPEVVAPVRRSWQPRPTPAPDPPPCETPVAIFFFDRPDPLARVVEAVRRARPRRLFLIADAARAGDVATATRCDEARAVAQAIDWECEVAAHFAAGHMGLKRRIESGLDWLFARVDRAILLEDDCVPHPSFFPFCEEMLERYRDEPRVMTVSGCDFRFGLLDDDASYGFSRYPLIWGWATWARAWRHHDPAMSGLAEAIEDGTLERQLGDPLVARYWAFVLDRERRIASTWDYAWLWSCWRQGALSVHPHVNLVSNIGFDAGATHTRDSRDALAGLPTEPMGFPLRHPPAVARDVAGDEMIEQTVFSGSLGRMWQRLRARRRALRRQAEGFAR